MDNQEFTAGAGVGLAVYLAGLLVGLVCYIFLCYCGKRICEKVGQDPGVLIWIPIAQWVPLLQAAKLPIWFIVLLLIPCVSYIALIVVSWKLCEARGKPGPMALLLLIPPIGLLVLPLYLAFSD